MKDSYWHAIKPWLMGVAHESREQNGRASPLVETNFTALPYGPVKRGHIVVATFVCGRDRVSQMLTMLLPRVQHLWRTQEMFVKIFPCGVQKCRPG